MFGVEIDPFTFQHACDVLKKTVGVPYNYLFEIKPVTLTKEIGSVVSQIIESVFDGVCVFWQMRENEINIQ